MPPNGWPWSSAPPIGQASRSPARRVLFRCSTPRHISLPAMRASLPRELKASIKRHGIRNALLTTIAPTGTISLFAGNVSSGIEPIFAPRYDRKILQPDGSHRSETIEDFAVRAFRAIHGPGVPLPASFVTTAELTPSEHLRMQAALQRHVDSSISKTINCPPDIPFEAFRRVYEEAYDLGLKGCTTYRPNAVTGAVLSTSESAAPLATLPPRAPRKPAEKSASSGCASRSSGRRCFQASPTS